MPLIAAVVTGCLFAFSQPTPPTPPASPAPPTSLAAAAPQSPDLAAIIAAPRSELAEVVQRFEADENALERKFPVDASPQRRERLTRFYQGWLDSLNSLPYATLSLQAKVDATLLKNLVSHALARINIDAKRQAAALVHAPFAEVVFQCSDDRREMRPLRPQASAAALDTLAAKVRDAQKSFEERLKPAKEGEPAPISPALSRDVLSLVQDLRNNLTDWYDFSAGYDPLFSWWCEQPYKGVNDALDSYVRIVREKGAGLDSDRAIVGIPIGREAILAELDFEMIPYTPEELIAIAERELAWCETEYKKAAAEMGLAEDWRAALEKVKQDHLEPGGQPALIRDLAADAVAFVRDRDLVTVPPLAEESWRMEMMSPQRQLVNPFFTGGEVISVSFPTSGMSQEDKLMSLRGNNIHFCHATVLHELIPGHHLQQYSNARSNTHRRIFSTPFWTEGWALYWEMLMWDLGYQKTPQDRIGALFWRSHRCARIICSLKFHLGEMTAPQWVDFLVDRIGHERANAQGEVRRSVQGGYGPLYQVAYMIGGLQFRALSKELVGSGKMTQRAFHDAILHESNIPVEMVRALLRNDPPPQDFKSNWRFDGP